MFTLFADWRALAEEDISTEIEKLRAAHCRYAEYLDRHRSKFPPAAFGYASAEWQENFNDCRAPHDSWVSEVKFVDRPLPGAGADRRTDLEIVLLGAFHDGHLHLRYTEVQSFHLTSTTAALGAIEVYRDEVRLSDNGHVVHEIEFLGAENWLVECKDMEWAWVPCPPAE